MSKEIAGIMNTSKNHHVRVRFAPSPTGHLHIGGLRTTLFNWLFARHNKGAFLLRIEDTDLERSKPEFVYSILEALDWCAISSDETVHIQSHSIEIHKKLIQKLLDEGKAYRCYCPPSTDIENMDYYRYGSFCRMREQVTVDQPFVVRIKLPTDKTHIEFSDLIYGPISFALDQFDDFIIARSDGTPVYNFVVVADDAAMKITHVIRGEEHLQNTPKQILLYQALGYDIPAFAHLPLILGPSGSKLSKRDGATAVVDYKKNGYLAAALCNYLVRLGWSHGDQEVFAVDELITYFSLDGVNKKAAIFDHKKLDWLNGVYLRKTDNQEIINLIQRDVDHAFCADLSQWSHNQLIGFIGLYKERCVTLLELSNKIRSLYFHDQEIPAGELEAWLKEDTVHFLQQCIEYFQTMPEYNAEQIKQFFKTFSKTENVPLVELAQPARLALTATVASPGVFELMALLGKDETVSRLRRFITLIEKR